MLETSNFVHESAIRSLSLVLRQLEWVFPKWAWSGSREQFLHCGLRKFCHSKSSVYRCYTPLDCRRFVYDTYKIMKGTQMHHGCVHMFITHRPTLTLQLHNFDLFRTCRTSSFCTVACQLARFQLTQRIARSLGDSWAFCSFLVPAHLGSPGQMAVKRVCVCVCVSVSIQLQQWTDFCTNISPKSGGRVPHVDKSWGRRPPASLLHYTPGQYFNARYTAFSLTITFRLIT